MGKENTTLTKERHPTKSPYGVCLQIDFHFPSCLPDSMKLLIGDPKQDKVISEVLLDARDFVDILDAYDVRLMTVKEIYKTTQEEVTVFIYSLGEPEVGVDYVLRNITLTRANFFARGAYHLGSGWTLNNINK